MPGNATKYTGARAYLPVVWSVTGIAANVVAPGQVMSLNGLPFNEFPLARDGSIVSVGIKISAAVTAGLIRFELTKGGVLTAEQFDMDSSSGLKSIWEFEPGELTFAKADEVGINAGSSAALLPAGTIDAILGIEVQWT